MTFVIIVATFMHKCVSARNSHLEFLVILFISFNLHNLLVDYYLLAFILKSRNK